MTIKSKVEEVQVEQGLTDATVILLLCDYIDEHADNPEQTATQLEEYLTQRATGADVCDETEDEWPLPIPRPRS